MNIDIRKQKEVLRENLLHLRGQLQEETFLLKSGYIIDRLKQRAEFDQARTIHCYVSMNEKREVNTYPLIKEILLQEKELVVPVTNFESGVLTHHRLYDVNNLRPNKWGVLEPVRVVTEEVGVHQLDLVIVPMVGGDRYRNRIGYGKGFYDRFLENVTCLKAGLLFEECLVEKIPVESFDIPLDMLITDKQVI